MHWKTMISKVALLTLILGLFLSVMSPIFIPKDGVLASHTRINEAFYDLDPDSLDILFLGASTFYGGISPLLLWGEHGFTGFVRGTPAQDPLVSYYYFLETLNTQSPKVVFLDVSRFFKVQGKDDKDEAWLRVEVDSLPLSLLKLRLLLAIQFSYADQNIFSYMFPFLRYHSRWDQLSNVDFDSLPDKINDNTFRGYRPFKGVAGESNQDLPNSYENFSAEGLKYFKKIHDICRQRNIDLVLIAMPRRYWNSSSSALINTFAESNNVKFLDYASSEMTKVTGLIYPNDYKDINHLNAKGARKITLNIGHWIEQEYDFIDKRSNPNYSTWETDYQTYRRWMKNYIPDYEIVD